MMQEAIFAINNLVRETKKYGTFNEYDDMLVLKELGSEGSVIYNFNGLKTIDVRGWVKDTIKAELPISIKVSADGKTWTDADATVRLSQAFNEFSTFSLLVENVADGMNFVKLVIENDEAVTAENISISDMQFLYTNEAPAEDDPTEDNPEDDDNEAEKNPDTGVATSAAAVILATLSGAATVISKRRR